MRRRLPRYPSRAGAAVLGLAAILAGCGGTPSQPPPGVASAPTGSTVIQGELTSDGAPLIQESASRLAVRRITVNLQIASLPEATHRFTRGPAAFLAGMGAQTANLPLRVRSTGELLLPVGFGATSVIYNLPTARGLRLRGGTLADVLLGRIQRWNDRAIQRENPGLHLPTETITVVHRSDPAVSTQLLTSYLTEDSRRWRAGPGAGATVVWPAGTSVPDVQTMRDVVSQTPGAIGYTDLPVALQNRLPVIALSNPSGRYLPPTLRSVSAAGAAGHAAGDLGLRTINAAVGAAYPVSSELYVATLRDPCAGGLSDSESSATRTLIGDLVNRSGQRTVRSFGFAPLPGSLRRAAERELRAFVCRPS